MNIVCKTQWKSLFASKDRNNFGPAGQEILLANCSEILKGSYGAWSLVVMMLKKKPHITPLSPAHQKHLILPFCFHFM